MGSIDDFVHVPVMARRIFELLSPALTQKDAHGAGAVLVDATIGLGGHTEYFLQQLPALTVIGIDQDRQALQRSKDRLHNYGDHIILVNYRFDEIDRALAEAKVNGQVQAFLYDFGVSSMQLDNPERGFAYSQDAPLDMRMNDQQELDAATIVNEYSEADITRFLKVYGEEKFASKIARAIVEQRRHTRFERTGQLVDLLYRVIPARVRRIGGHPAKRTFQALRIAVNKELDAIETSLPRAFSRLEVGGRVATMSYQSLEDTISKKYFNTLIKSTNPQGLPIELPEYSPKATAITRGALQADQQEAAANPRSKSVRVRVIEKIRT